MPSADDDRRLFHSAGLRRQTDLLELLVDFSFDAKERPDGNGRTAAAPASLGRATTAAPSGVSFISTEAIRERTAGHRNRKGFGRVYGGSRRRPK
jgi:hypothetical protein